MSETKPHMQETARIYERLLREGKAHSDPALTILDACDEYIATLTAERDAAVQARMSAEEKQAAVERGTGRIAEALHAAEADNAALVFDMIQAYQQLGAFWDMFHSCPCGARAESMDTHPHVLGCPTDKRTMVMPPHPGEALLRELAGLRERCEKAEGEQLPRELRGDGPCSDCGTIDNIVWFTESVFWNAVCRETPEFADREEVLCIPCFVVRADKAGFQPTGWRLLPEWPWARTEERIAWERAYEAVAGAEGAAKP